MEYTLEERIQEFLFNELREEIDLEKLTKQYFLHKKKKKKSKPSKKKSDYKFSFSTLNIKALLERFEFLSEFYLLALKTKETLSAKATKIDLARAESSRAILGFMDMNLEYLNQVLVHLMFVVFLKKFNKTQLDESLFSGTDHISHYSSYFQKIFKSSNTLLAIYSSLDKDMRQIIRSCVKSGVTFSEVNQDAEVGSL
jgi:hypothetical protein